MREHARFRISGCKTFQKQQARSGELGYVFFSLTLYALEPAACSAGHASPFGALCRCISVVYQGQFWANTEQMGCVIEAAVRDQPGVSSTQRGKVC